LGNFFNTMIVIAGVSEDGEPIQRKPKLGYAQKIRCCIKNSIIEEFKVDICDPLQFPEAAWRWKIFIDDLAGKGLAETVHYGEVDPHTMDLIFELLANVEEALDKRGADDYDTYLGRIPVSHREKLLEDAVKKLKFVKHIASEKDKNHGEGTVSALNGCIPLINFGRFNPGRYFDKYLNSLPDASTKPETEGGFLFMKPKTSSRKWSMHSPESRILFEANMKGNI
jgi:hypothetical protein